MMPDMSGLELLRLVREDSDTAELPIVLLSARAGPEAAVEGLDLGADDYLAKPFSAEDLFARVNARLAAGKERRKRRALAALAAALGRATQSRTSSPPCRASLNQELGADNTTLALVDEDNPSVVRFTHASRYGAGIDERYHTGSVDGPAPPMVAIRGPIDDRDREPGGGWRSGSSRRSPPTSRLRESRRSSLSPHTCDGPACRKHRCELGFAPPYSGGGGRPRAALRGARARRNRARPCERARAPHPGASTGEAPRDRPAGSDRHRCRSLPAVRQGLSSRRATGTTSSASRAVGSGSLSVTSSVVASRPPR